MKVRHSSVPGRERRKRARKQVFSLWFYAGVEVTTGTKLVPLLEVNFDDLIAYDTEIHRINREQWIRDALDTSPDSVAALDKSNQIQGYVVVEHQPNNVTQLKPLLADSTAVATLLLRHALTTMPPGEKVKIKIPSENPAAQVLMIKIGWSPEMKPGDRTLFTKRKFQVQMKRVFSVMNGNNMFA